MATLGARERRLAGRLAAAGCLIFFFALALRTALAKTLTADEPAHMIRAVALNQTGDLRFQLGHAPFSHRLLGGLLFSDEQLPAVNQLATWELGDRLRIAAELLWEAGINVEQLLLLTRLPIVLLGVLLGALVGSWALKWQGTLAMGMALILFASWPDLIAHAALATTDLATAATYFATGFAWWRFWQGGQKRWWLLAAVFLGLALATKLTALLLLPVLLLQALLYGGRGRALWRAAWIWLLLLPPAALVLWVVYGFEVGQPAGWPIPLAAPSYLESWQTVLDHVDAGHQSFFWGDLSKRGWWYYFPVAFVIKTPLLTLLLLVTAAVVVARRRALWRTALFLLIPVGALFGAAIVSRLNIGTRHILPAVPFLLVFGSAAVLFFRQRRATRILLSLGLAWAILAALWQHPDHLAYFNPAVGGTAQGYRYLGDSNLDWGQDLKLLVETVNNDPGTWFVSYHGVSDTAYYGLAAETVIDVENAWGNFAAANPPPGQYALSVNHLQGLLPDADLFDWFWRQEPATHLGGSIQVYEVEAQAQGTWVAQCLDPLPLLTAAEAESLVGQSNLRHLFFDCGQSLVLADAGAAGWVVLPQADTWWFGEALPMIRDNLQLVYRHDAAAGTPSFDVYYWPGGEVMPPAASWRQGAETAAGEVIVLPYAVNETAVLAGYQVGEAQWLTMWLVQAATGQPLSLQAHLYAAEDERPQIGDGLGFSSEQWQGGDWFVQRHLFAGAEEALFMQTGVYDYQTLELVGEAVRLPAE
jgi:hypothetical protein